MWTTASFVDVCDEAVWIDATTARRTRGNRFIVRFSFCGWERRVTGCRAIMVESGGLR
jgi:hypothetical protein